MKKLNFKRLAAVIAGGALLATAAAPLATAAFTNLTKDDLVNANGVPVVSIVGGANAAVSDFVWAGNIAAKVAQLATKTMTVTQGTGGTSGTPTDLAVNLTVGGTLTYAGGVREFQNTNLNSAANSAEYADTIENNYFKQFFNGTVSRTIDGNASVNMSIIEKIGITADGRFDPTSAHDLVAYVDPLDMNYQVTFSPGIPYPFTDSGSDDYVPIYFMGEPYLVDRINSTGTQVVLIKDGADQVLAEGDTFEALGKDDKTYTVRFDKGVMSGTTPIARFSLLDDTGTVVATINNATADGDLTFRINGVEVLTTKARIPTNGIMTTTTSNTTEYFVQVILGTGRVEIQNGYEVPYDSTGTHSVKPWTARMTTNNNTLTGIIVENSSYFHISDNPLYAVQAFNNTGKPTEFEFFKGTGLDTIGTFKFQGFYDVGVQRSKIEFLKGTNVATGTDGTTYGAIHYFDTAGVEHFIPMAIRLSATGSDGTTLTFDGFQQSYWTNSQTTISTLAVSTAPSTNPNDYNANKVTVLTTDTNWDSSAIVRLTGKGGNNTYKYLVRRHNSNPNQVFLTLVGGQPLSGDTTNYNGYIGTTQYNAGDIFLLGTALDDSHSANLAFNGHYTEADGNYLFRPYYYPDFVDYNGTNPGTTTGVYRTAVFKVAESLGNSSTTMPVNGTPKLFNVFIDTEGGNAGTVDTANNNKFQMDWPTGTATAAQYFGTDQNLTSFSEYAASTANYTKAFTANGTKVELVNREISITLPNTAMKAYFTVESKGTTQEVTGGESNVTPLAKGDTFTTTGGTKVTITDITGTCAVGSGACTPATYESVVPLSGNLVYTDQSAPSGKVIIVGGYYVNSLARGLSVSGGTLEDVVNAPGTYVAEKLANGNIIVAGYTASDTIAAAQELIAALDDLMTA